MSNLAFVVGAILLSALGTFIIWFRHRRPRSMQSGIDEFAKELKALAPDRRDEFRG